MKRTRHSKPFLFPISPAQSASNQHGQAASYLASGKLIPRAAFCGNGITKVVQLSAMGEIVHYPVTMTSKVDPDLHRMAVVLGSEYAKGWQLVRWIGRSKLGHGYDDAKPQRGAVIRTECRGIFTPKSQSNPKFV